MWICKVARILSLFKTVDMLPWHTDAHLWMERSELGMAWYLTIFHLDKDKIYVHRGSATRFIQYTEDAVNDKELQRLTYTRNILNSNAVQWRGWQFFCGENEWNT